MPWDLTGNAGTTPTTNFLGTTDNQPLAIRTNGTERLRVTADGQLTVTGRTLRVLVPGSSSPIGALTIDVETFGTGANAQASHYFRVGDLGNAGFTPFYIRGDGNVGIGTNAPPASLTVDAPGDDTTWNTAAFRKAAIGPFWSHIHWGPTGDWYIRSAASTGNIVLQDTGGNVGIGTNAPPASLTVDAPGDDTTWNTAAFRKAAIGPFWSHIHWGPTGDWYIRSAASTGNIVLQDTGGNVGIGTNAPPASLTVDAPGDDTTWNTAAFRKAAIGPFWSHIHWGPTGDWYIRSAASTGNIVLQDTGGNVGIGTNAPGTKLAVAGDISANDVLLTSDARLKTDVAPVEGALERLQQLRGVVFSWRDPAAPAEPSPPRRQIGVIAQEVEAVFGELVDSHGPDGHKGVKHSGLTAVLIEACKELGEQNSTLRRRVEALECAVAGS